MHLFIDIVATALLATLLGLAAPGAGAAERYQIATLSAGAGFAPDKALILDTESGHLWLWIENAGTGIDAGGRYLIYQGQVRPGRAAGEIIEKQEWAPKP